MNTSSHILRVLACTAIAIGMLRGDGIAQELSTIDEQEPLRLDGSVGVMLSGYSTSGIDRGLSPFSWMVQGALTPSVYGVDIPLSFVISDQESEFHQPFNQVGISPSYKSITGHFGYRSLSFSRYTLAGVTFLGAGVEANPGQLRFGAMYGRLQRAVEEDSTQPHNIPAYERTGYAFKLGFGSNSSYVDLSFLKAKDDTASLAKAPSREDITPAENSVLGFSMKFPIVPELSFDAEGGASLMTNDLRSGPIGIDTSDIPEFLLGLQDLRSSTTLTFAARAGLNLRVPNFGLRLGYERIEPEFTTLGSYYFASDIENWTVEPSFDLFDNRLRLNGSIGLQRDNLLDTKLAQTDRVIGSGNINWDPSEIIGFDAQYSNYSTGQSAGRVAVNDSVRVRNVSQSASLAPRLLLQDEKYNHSVVLVAGYQNYSDLNAYTNLTTNTDSKTLSLNYNLTVIDQAISTGASLIYSDSRSGTISSSLIGGSLNGSIVVLDGGLSLGGSVGYSRSAIDGVDGAGNVFNESLNASYQLSPDDAFTLGINATQSSGELNTYQEVGGSLNYSRTFSLPQMDTD